MKGREGVDGWKGERWKGKRNERRFGIKDEWGRVERWKDGTLATVKGESVE